MKKTLWLAALLLLAFTIAACEDESEAALEVDPATLQESYDLETFEYESIELIYTENSEEERITLEPDLLVSRVPEESGTHLAVAEYEGERVNFLITFD